VKHASTTKYMLTRSTGIVQNAAETAAAPASTTAYM
jgi:hypothetical protein